jgi:hypothetical protein
MNWTKTLPTRPGAYWWRRNADRPATLCETKIDPAGILDVWGEWGVISVALRGGEWCGPLVPVEEVENGKLDAMREGMRRAAKMIAPAFESGAVFPENKILSAAESLTEKDLLSHLDFRRPT